SVFHTFDRPWTGARNSRSAADRSRPEKRIESRNGDNDRARRLSAREVGSTHRRHGGNNRVGLRDSYPRLERSDFVVIDFSSARKASRAFLALALRVPGRSLAASNA